MEVYFDSYKGVKHKLNDNGRQFLVDIKTESIEPIRMDREPLWCSRSRTSRTTSSFVLMTSWLDRSSECADVKWIRGNFILKLVGQGRDVLLMRELSNFPLLLLRPSLLRWKKKLSSFKSQHNKIQLKYPKSLLLYVFFAFIFSCTIQIHWEHSSVFDFQIWYSSNRENLYYRGH